MLCLFHYWTSLLCNTAVYHQLFPDAMYRGVGSFRDARAFGSSAGHGRAALGLAQRRWIALFKKRKVVLRFDVSLPPFPCHGFVLSLGVVVVM